jgi:DNA-binding CsgD family transcriptional regulator
VDGGEQVNAYIIAMDTVAAITLVTLAAGLVIAARRARRGPFRALSLGGVAVCLLLVFSSLHRLLMVAVRAGLLAAYWVDWLLGPIAAIEATLSVVVGVAALVVARQYRHRVGRAHAMVELLTDRLPADASARQAGLTSREQEVLDLIRRGLISDREIAQALHISPATAATHVQRILRKTGLHNRRDLMLLPRAKSAA